VLLLIDAVADAAAKFEDYAKEVGVDKELAKSIKADFWEG
jgi:hypothetical protein